MSWLTTAPHSSHWHPVCLLEHTATCSTLTLEPTHPKVRSTSQSAGTSGTASKSHSTSPIPTGLVFLCPRCLLTCPSATCLQKQKTQPALTRIVNCAIQCGLRKHDCPLGSAWLGRLTNPLGMSVSFRSTWACICAFQTAGAPASPLFRSVLFLH